jgi:acyl carrier protein
MSVVTDVEQFLLQEVLTGSAVERISPDEDLLLTGIVDSHGVLQLVRFIEDRFGVAVRDEQLTPDNFQTLERIDALVQQAKG